MTETYTSILAELMRRRDALTLELSGVNAAIEAIRPLLQGESYAPSSVARSSQPHPVANVIPSAAPTPQIGNYANLSVRWAALWHLAEFARGPMRNAEVAEAILAGGYHSGAGSFPNAVSAVLSGMRSKGEIDGNPEIGYYLTDKGKEIWHTIRRSERFRSIMAHSSSATEPSLLSVQ
jgi:hypothetical protein